MNITRPIVSSTLRHRPKISVALAVACLLGAASARSQTTIYSDNNFSNNTAPGFTFANSGGATAAVETGAPTYGNDTNHLRLTNPNTGTPGILSAALNFGTYTQSSPLNISFDLAYKNVFAMGGTATNSFFFTVNSSNSTQVFNNFTASRYNVGDPASRLTYGDRYGNNPAGYLDSQYTPSGGSFQDAYYHYSLSLPGIGTSGNAVLTITSPSGEPIFDINQNRVNSLTISQAVSGATDYQQLSFRDGFQYGTDTNADLSISNLNVSTVPEPVYALHLMMGLTTVFALWRRGTFGKIVSRTTPSI